MNVKYTGKGFEEGKEYELKDSFRCHMFYENITGKSFSPTGLGDMLIWFYCNILAAAKGKDAILWDDFVDWCDANPEVFNEFTQWYIDLVKVSQMTEPQTKNDDKKQKKSKSKN